MLHYGRAGTGAVLEPGMIFTIEPMINAGRAAIRCLADGWTIVTADHSLSAQWEHTILVTAGGPRGPHGLRRDAGAAGALNRRMDPRRPRRPRRPRLRGRAAGARS